MIRSGLIAWLLLLAGVAHSSTLTDQQFVANTSAFTGTGATYSTNEGPDYVAGVARFTTNNGSDRALITFEEQTTGKTLVEFWIRVTDTTATATTANTGGIYVFSSATNHNTAGSADSAAVLLVNRDSAAGANSAYWVLQYRNGDSGTFLTIGSLARQQWHNIGLLIDQATDTYDVYVDGLLMTKGALCPAGAQVGTAGKFVILNPTTSANQEIDGVVVTSGASIGEPSTNLLIEHQFTTGLNGEIETLYPDRDVRNPRPQPWKIPDDTTSFGAFTINANGAVPDSNKLCGTCVRGTPFGAVELDWTEASSGNRGVELIVGNWAGLGSDSYLRLGYDSNRTAGQQLQIGQGSTMLQQSAGTTGGVSYSASTSHTLRLERRGRYLQGYVDGVLQLTHTITSTGTGARGQLSEENIGFIVDTRTSGGQNLGTTNYVTAIRIYGDMPETSRTFAIDDLTYQVSGAGPNYVADAGNDNPSRNLFWSKGFQPSHVSEADPTTPAIREKTHYEGYRLRSYQYRGQNWREDALLLARGSDYTYTLTPRGIWLRESLIYIGSSGINWTPDQDFRTELWGSSIYSSRRTAAGVISSPTVTNKGFATWANVWASPYDSGIYQILTAGTNKTMATVYCGQGADSTPNDLLYFTAKREGNLDPFSVAFNYAQANLTAGNTYTTSRLMMFDTGSGVAESSSFREALLADLEQVATLTMSVGTSNGWLPQFGWYSLDADNNAVAFAFDGVTDRVRPQFHIDDLQLVVTVLVDGVSQAEGTDYWWTPDGNGGTVLGFTGTLADDASISVSGTGGPSLAQWNRLLRARNLGSESNTDSAYDKLRRALMSSN